MFVTFIDSTNQNVRSNTAGVNNSGYLGYHFLKPTQVHTVSDWDMSVLY